MERTYRIRRLSAVLVVAAALVGAGGYLAFPRLFPPTPVATSAPTSTPSLSGLPECQMAWRYPFESGSMAKVTPGLRSGDVGLRAAIDKDRRIIVVYYDVSIDPTGEPIYWMMFDAQGLGCQKINPLPGDGKVV